MLWLGGRCAPWCGSARSRQTACTKQLHRPPEGTCDPARRRLHLLSSHPPVTASFPAGYVLACLRGNTRLPVRTCDVVTGAAQRGRLLRGVCTANAAL